MHSKIIQLEDEPIPENRFVTVSDIPDWFVSGIADYVIKVDDVDIVKTVTQVFDRNGIRFDPDNRTVTFTDTEYFQEKFIRFKEILTQIQSKLTLGWFSHNMGVEMAELGVMYNNRFGDYIYHDRMLHTLDEFVRNHADRDTRYYVGGILDYHY